MQLESEKGVAVLVRKVSSCSLSLCLSLSLLSQSAGKADQHTTPASSTCETNQRSSWRRLKVSGHSVTSASAGRSYSVMVDPFHKEEILADTIPTAASSKTNSRSSFTASPASPSSSSSLSSPSTPN